MAFTVPWVAKETDESGAPLHVEIVGVKLWCNQDFLRNKFAQNENKEVKSSTAARFLHG